MAEIRQVERFVKSMENANDNLDEIIEKAECGSPLILNRLEDSGSRWSGYTGNLNR